MDNIISRFPSLAERIFDSLDDENLVNSKTVSRSWSEFTENEVFYLRRIVKKLIGRYEYFRETWKLVMKRANIEMMKELVLVVKYHLSKHPANCPDEPADCDHRDLCFSPLHIGAEVGQVSLCEFILKITKDKNPKQKLNCFQIEKYFAGWTPLHEAAKGGHLVICYMIMNEISDKNPGDDSGATPLHKAAKKGHLEICKMIMNKVTDINPRDHEGRTPLHEAAKEGHLEVCKMIMNEVTDINPRDHEGWTPLHAAAEEGHKEVCKFIVDKVEDKNPEDANGVTPHELMWNGICGMEYI